MMAVFIVMFLNLRRPRLLVVTLVDPFALFRVLALPDLLGWIIVILTEICSGLLPP